MSIETYARNAKRAYQDEAQCKTSTGNAKAKARQGKASKTKEGRGKAKPARTLNYRMFSAVALELENLDT